MPQDDVWVRGAVMSRLRVVKRSTGYRVLWHEEALDIHLLDTFCLPPCHEFLECLQVLLIVMECMLLTSDHEFNESVHMSLGGQQLFLCCLFRFLLAVTFLYRSDVRE